jgi:hypothetical protein
MKYVDLAFIKAVFITASILVSLTTDDWKRKRENYAG